MLNYIRRNHAAMILIALGLLLVFGPSSYFEAFKLGLGPEFVLKVFGKIFYAGVALGLTQYVVGKMFPTIDVFCSRQRVEDKKSEFTILFQDRSRDPRLWICVFVHGTVFLGVCLILALAF